MSDYNVVSLFDGMSCGRVALERAGIGVGKYYAAEIDKYAAQVSANNYPDIIRLGDVTKWREWDIDWDGVDMVMGGFPCQPFSLAGKQLGDKDPRGQLFWTMLDIMSHAQKHNPNVRFLIENVKMKKEFEEYITFHTRQALGTVHKTLINSSLVSAQNRQRWYWTSFPVTCQPEDKGVPLHSILESDVGEKYYHTDKAIEYMNRVGSTGRVKWSYSFHSDSVVNKKSSCVTANFFKGVPNNVLVSPYTGGCKARAERADSDVVKNMKVCVESVPSTSVRKFTPVELERLQTLPDNYTQGVSDTQRYKMIGNGWTVDVIVHLLREMLK